MRNLKAGVLDVGEWLVREGGPHAFAPGISPNGEPTTRVRFDKNGQPRESDIGLGIRSMLVRPPGGDEGALATVGRRLFGVTSGNR
jgi:hypothetical protein